MTVVYELRIGERVVTHYDTLAEAEEARDWYLRTYGQPSSPLEIVDVIVPPSGEKKPQ